jgi:hypothetical protein
MSKRDADLKDVLSSIEKQLKSIQRTLGSFEKRIGALEEAFEQRVSVPGENPLIFSRVLMGTVDAIKQYEKDHGQGVVAKDLARVRGVELPTIYDHLSKLEDAELIFWQRGTELGLKPANAKFYSVSTRDEQLEDIPVLMALPEYVTPIAQAILKGGKDGTSREELLEIALALKDRGENPWTTLSQTKIADKLDEALKFLLRRVLIRSEKTLETDNYYPLTG